MHILFITSILSLFGVSLYFASWTSSVICSVLILLVIWTRLFSDRIIRKSFRNLTKINQTEMHHFEDLMQKAFSSKANNPDPTVYLDPLEKNLQIYCFGSQLSPKIIATKQALQKIGKRDLNALIGNAGLLHSQNVFSGKQGLVAMFVYLGFIGRYIDTTLSFILGIKTKHGEPKALIRKPIYFFLSKLNFQYGRKNQGLQPVLKNYSYLSREHSNPILSPLSISDRNF